MCRKTLADSKTVSEELAFVLCIDDHWPHWLMSLRYRYHIIMLLASTASIESLYMMSTTQGVSPICALLYGNSNLYSARSRPSGEALTNALGIHVHMHKCTTLHKYRSVKAGLSRSSRRQSSSNSWPHCFGCRLPLQPVMCSFPTFPLYACTCSTSMHVKMS